MKEAINSVNASKAVIDLKDNINKSLTLKYYHTSSSSGEIYDNLGDLLLESSPLTAFSGDKCKILYSFPIYLSTSIDASPSTSSPDLDTAYYLNSYYNNVSWIEFDLIYSRPSSSTSGNVSCRQTLKCRLENGAETSAIFYGYNGGSLLKFVIVTITLYSNSSDRKSPRLIQISSIINSLKISDGANVTENGTWTISNLRGIK